MSCNCNQSRRQFLRTASMASMAGFYVSPFLLELNSLAAMAQGTGGSDYRALVCVYLQGGNDGHGTVIATDPGSFAAFTSRSLRRARPRLSHERIAAHHAQDSANRPHLRAQSFARRRADSLQRGPRRHRRQHRDAGRSGHQNADQRQLRPAARFALLALRSNRRMAGHRLQSRQQRARGMGRRRRRRHRSHEHELQLHVHLHLHRRQRALPRRAIFVSAQRHARRPHPHLRASEPSFWPARPRPTHSTPSSPPTKPISSPRSTRSSSTAPCRRRPRWPPPWLPRRAAAWPIRRSISIP